MSSISSIGGGNGLYQFVQNLSASAQSQPTAASTQTISTSATDGASSGQAVQGHHHRHHGQGGGDKGQLFQQVQQAVTSALQSASQNGTDPNQAIEDAITKVFQNNNSAPPQASDGSTPANSGTPAAANTPTTAAPGSNGNSALQAFFQTLQSAGVDPQQFHQDFLTAVQDAQNGSVNAGTAFQSLPTGSIIDAYG